MDWKLPDARVTQVWRFVLNLLANYRRHFSRLPASSMGRQQQNQSEHPRPYYRDAEVLDEVAPWSSAILELMHNSSPA